MKNQNQQPTPTSQEQTEAKAEVIKLGIDVHQRRHVVVSQTDNETMRSPRGFDPEEFLTFVVLPNPALAHYTQALLVDRRRGCLPPRTTCPADAEIAEAIRACRGVDPQLPSEISFRFR